MDDDGLFQIRLAAKCDSKGLVNEREFGLRVLELLFYAAAEERDALLACLSETQSGKIRTFADGYFSDNGYEPEPDLPPGVPKDVREQCMRSNRGKWLELHQWIIQATGG